LASSRLSYPHNGIAGIVSVVCLAALPSAAIHAAEPVHVVREVKLEGNRHVNEERIRFLLEVRATKTYSSRELQDAVADDVRAIETMGPFTYTRSELKYSDDLREVTVTYKFRELPYVAKVSIQGLDYFDKEKAEKVLTTKVGSYLNDLLLENDRRALERMFQDRGDRWCRVRAQTDDDRGSIGVVFTVELGQQVKVGQVNYVGLPDGARPRIIDTLSYTNLTQPTNLPV
jgi:outer membrane protein assembly factor BamA